MNRVDLIKAIKREISRAGSQRKLAKKWGISLGYLNDVLAGRRNPGRLILDRLGLQRVELFQPRGR